MAASLTLTYVCSYYENGGEIRCTAMTEGLKTEQMEIKRLTHSTGLRYYQPEILIQEFGDRAGGDKKRWPSR